MLPRLREKRIPRPTNKSTLTTSKGTRIDSDFSIKKYEIHSHIDLIVVCLLLLKIYRFLSFVSMAMTALEKPSEFDALHLKLVKSFEFTCRMVIMLRNLCPSSWIVLFTWSCALRFITMRASGRSASRRASRFLSTGTRPRRWTCSAPSIRSSTRDHCRVNYTYSRDYCVALSLQQATTRSCGWNNYNIGIPMDGHEWCMSGKEQACANDIFLSEDFVENNCLSAIYIVACSIQ